MVDRVLVSGLPGRDDHRRAARIGRWHQAHFRGRVVGGGNYDVLFGGRERDVGEEARVVLLIDHFVRVGFALGHFAELVQADLIGPPLVVEQRVEERGIVRRPHRVALGVLDDVGKQCPCFEILDAQSETLAATGVRAVGEQTSVMRNRERPQAKIVVAFRQRRFVENHFGIGGRALARPGAVRWPTRPDAILLALLEAPLVVERAVLHGHVGVLGRLPRLDLLEQFLDQALARRHPRLEIGVLFLQIRQHVGVVHGWVAVVLQPTVGVLHRVAMQGEGVRTSLRCGRFRHGVRRHVRYRAARGNSHAAGEASDQAMPHAALGGTDGVNRAAPARAWR